MGGPLHETFRLFASLLGRPVRKFVRPIRTGFDFHYDSVRFMHHAGVPFGHGNLNDRRSAIQPATTENLASALYHQQVGATALQNEQFPLMRVLMRAHIGAGLRRDDQPLNLIVWPFMQQKMRPAAWR